VRHVQFRSFADKDSTVTESSKEVIGAICGVILCSSLIVAVFLYMYLNSKMPCFITKPGKCNYVTYTLLSGYICCVLFEE